MVKIQVVVSWLSVGCLTACAVVEGEPLDAEARVAAADGEQPHPSQAACSDQTYVARVATNAPCPVLDDWNEVELFALGDATAERWCRYTMKADADSKDAQDALLEDSGLNTASTDCRSVFPQADPTLDELTAPGLRQSFHQRVGRVHASQLKLPDTGEPSESLRSPVRVAVVDTVGSWRNVSYPDVNSMHGVNMARIIDDLACPVAGDCAVDVQSELGLPRTRTNPIDTSRGGFVGTHADLASAIVSAVDTWLAPAGPDDVAPSELGPLVINLSLGWEPTFFGGNDLSTDPARVTMVHSALEYASCHRALVVAAVGNDVGDCADGPLAPGAWEQLAAPDADRCEQLGVTADFQERPLLYAVGGLGEGDERMPLSRGAARTRLAATATYAVAGDPDVTIASTGTSVAAAAVSGAAALLWSYAPDLSGDAIMAALYTNGPELGWDAEVHPDAGPVPKAHRLDICSAMEDLCDSAPNCPLNLDCQLGDGKAAMDAAVGITLEQAQSVTPTPMGSLAVQPCDALCGGSGGAITLEAGAAQGDACEVTYDNPLARFAAPQPNDAPCPECTIVGTELVGTLDPAHSGRSVHSVTLTVAVPGGRRRLDVTDAFALRVGRLSRTTLDSAIVGAVSDTAYISVTFDDVPDYAVGNAVRRR